MKEITKASKHEVIARYNALKKQIPAHVSITREVFERIHADDSEPKKISENYINQKFSEGTEDIRIMKHLTAMVLEYNAEIVSYREFADKLIKGKS